MHLWLQIRFPHVLTAKSMVKRIPQFFQSSPAEMVVEEEKHALLSELSPATFTNVQMHRKKLIDLIGWA